MSKKMDIPTYPTRSGNRRMSRCRCYSCNTIGRIQWGEGGTGEGAIEALGWRSLDEWEERWVCGDCHEKMEESRGRSASWPANRFDDLKGELDVHALLKAPVKSIAFGQALAAFKSLPPKAEFSNYTRQRSPDIGDAELPLPFFDRDT